MFPEVGCAYSHGQELVFVTTLLMIRDIVIVPTILEQKKRKREREREAFRRDLSLLLLVMRYRRKSDPMCERKTPLGKKTARNTLFEALKKGRIFITLLLCCA